MTRLIMRRGPQPGKVFELKSEVETIGSGTKNSVVILDNDVNREHCRLIRVLADYELEDLNSVRGTFVSGQKIITTWVLKPGNLIELGENVTLEYERASAAAELEKLPARPVTNIDDKPSPDANPFLVMAAGPKPGNIYDLKKPKITIGRDLTNDIVIQDPEISRFHLVLRWADSSYTIEDLGSTNGTMVNDSTLTARTPTRMHANDVIQIATSLTLIYTWQPGDVKIDSKPTITPTVVPRRTTSIQKPQTAKLDTGENASPDTQLFNPASKRQTSRLGTGFQPGSLVDHVFITYARAEWASVVAPLNAALEDEGMKVWVDQYLIQGGDDWMVAVEQALSECWLLIAVVSPEALDSRYVRLAYRYFFNREKPIIPLLYANVESLPMELKNAASVRYNPQDQQATFRDLITEIHARSK